MYLFHISRRNCVKLHSSDVFFMLNPKVGHWRWTNPRRRWNYPKYWCQSRRWNYPNSPKFLLWLNSWLSTQSSLQLGVISRFESVFLSLNLNNEHTLQERFLVLTKHHFLFFLTVFNLRNYSVRKSGSSTRPQRQRLSLVLNTTDRDNSRLSWFHSLSQTFVLTLCKAITACKIFHFLRTNAMSDVFHYHFKVFKFIVSQLNNEVLPGSYDWILYCSIV